MFYSLAALVRKILFLPLESKRVVQYLVYLIAVSTLVSKKQNRNLTSGGNGCRYLWRRLWSACVKDNNEDTSNWGCLWWILLIISSFCLVWSVHETNQRHGETCGNWTSHKARATRQDARTDQVRNSLSQSLSLFHFHFSPSTSVFPSIHNVPHFSVSKGWTIIFWRGLGQFQKKIHVQQKRLIKKKSFKGNHGKKKSSKCFLLLRSSVWLKDKIIPQAIAHP